MAEILGKRKSTCTSTFSIKISEIPVDIGEDNLRSMFDAFGNILGVHLKDSQPLNHAFINYDSPHSAVNAADQMNGFKVPGGVLKVKLQQVISAKRYRPAASAANTVALLNDNLNCPSSIDESTGSKGVDQQFSVKISNINPNSTQEDLSKLFKTTVIVKDVLASSKKYAYANFKYQEEMDEALKLNDTLFDNCKIQVKIASSSKNVLVINNVYFICTIKVKMHVHTYLKICIYLSP